MGKMTAWTQQKSRPHERPTLLTSPGMLDAVTAQQHKAILVSKLDPSTIQKLKLTPFHAASVLVVQP
jgi:hypothetical protein